MVVAKATYCQTWDAKQELKEVNKLVY